MLCRMSSEGSNAEVDPRESMTGEIDTEGDAQQSVCQLAVGSHTRWTAYIAREFRFVSGKEDATGGTSLESLSISHRTSENGRLPFSQMKS